jgi:Putative sensor
MIDIQEPTTTATYHRRDRPGAIARVGRDAGYVLAMFGLSTADFWIFGACLLATAILLPTVIGALVGVASAFILRGLTDVDRRLAGWYLRRPIHGRYRKPSAPGMIALVKTVGRDPRTWKDAGWVLGNSFVGLALGTVALVVTSLTISYLVTPLWWWAVPHPHEDYVVLNLGIYTVTSTGLALVTSAIGLVLLPLAIALNRRIATAHARVARRALED